MWVFGCVYLTRWVGHTIHFTLYTLRTTNTYIILCYNTLLWCYYVHVYCISCYCIPEEFDIASFDSSSKRSNTFSLLQTMIGEALKIPVRMLIRIISLGEICRASFPKGGTVKTNNFKILRYTYYIRLLYFDIRYVPIQNINKTKWTTFLMLNVECQRGLCRPIEST